jgi:hypothetical protein
LESTGSRFDVAIRPMRRGKGEKKKWRPKIRKRKLELASWYMLLRK